MMNRGIATLVRTLIVGIIIALVCGCHTFQSVSADKREQVLKVGGEDLKLHLHNGTTEEIDAGHYIIVKGPKSFTYVRGTFHSDTGDSTAEFAGPIAGSPDDSVRTRLTPAGSFDDKVGREYVYHIQGGTVRVIDGNLIRVDSAKGDGLWYSSRIQDRLSFKGESMHIGLEEIQEVETRKTNVPLTIVTAGVLIPMALVVTLGIIVYGSGRQVIF